MSGRPKGKNTQAGLKAQVPCIHIPGRPGDIRVGHGAGGSANQGKCPKAKDCRQHSGGISERRQEEDRPLALLGRFWPRNQFFSGHLIHKGSDDYGIFTH